MVNQDNYQKVLTFYNQLKNQWVDVEATKIDLYNKVSGKQMWDAKDRAYLESQRRPALQYNLMLPVLLYLTGKQRQDRSYMRAIPNSDGVTEEASRLMTKLMYWNYNRTRYEYESSKANMHSMIGSIGWKHDWYDYMEGHWVCKAHDALRIRFDIRTQSSTLDDCRYLQDTSWATKEEIFALIDDPDTLKLVKEHFYILEPKSSTSFLDKQFANWTWSYLPKQQEWDFVDSSEGRYRLIDHHEMRDVTETVLLDVYDKDNFIVTTGMDAEQVQGLIAQHPNMVKYEYNRKEFWHTIICPAIQCVIVDEPYPIQTGQFAFKPVVCYDIIPQLRETTSVFTNLKDVNDSINKRKSTWLEYIMKTVSGNWIGREDSFVKEEDWENNLTGVILKYRKNTEKPVRDVPPPISQGLVEYEQEDKEMVQKISGITPNLVGFRESANETGTLARQKIQQAEITFGQLFDNFNLSYLMDARSCIKHIQQGMTLPRQIRVLNNNGDPEWLRFNYETLAGKVNDVTFGEYDIEIDASKPSITMQQLAFYELSDTLKTMPPEVSILLLDKYLMASSIPDKDILVKRIQAVIKKQFGFDPENPDAPIQPPMPQQGGAPQQMPPEMQDVMQNIPQGNLDSLFAGAGIS